MKINVVSVEESLMCIGVRRVSAYLKELNPDTTAYYVCDTRARWLVDTVLARSGAKLDPETEMRRMAEPIADADIVCFSSMTHLAARTKALIKQVRRVNPRAYIIWGGIHPITAPEDAIPHADAVCTGEGEFASAEVLDGFRNGRDYTATRNFWFNQRGKIVRNGFRSLMTSADMDTLPLPTYGRGEFVYDARKGDYVPLSGEDYVDYVGPVYNTIWAIGCPFKCTYCGNTKFLQNDAAYGKFRYSSPQRLIDEIQAARRVDPHIKSVNFADDGFMGLPPSVLQEFARLYKKQVGIPFGVVGITPNYVKREKIETLLEAGLQRVAMGVQSGSKRILEFYKRPSSPARILSAAATLADYSKYLIPPNYSIIVDNPIETRDDSVETLELIYKMRRPFNLMLYSLRLIPNTDLVKQFEEAHVTSFKIDEKTYMGLTPTWANCLLLLLSLVRPPRWLFERWLKSVQSPTEPQPMYPKLLSSLRMTLFAKEGLNRLRFLDFSPIPGRLGTAVWKSGLGGLWSRYMIPRFTRSPMGTVEKEVVQKRAITTLPVISASVAPIAATRTG